MTLEATLTPDEKFQAEKIRRKAAAMRKMQENDHSKRMEALLRQQNAEKEKEAAGMLKAAERQVAEKAAAEKERAAAAEKARAEAARQEREARAARDKAR